MKQVSVTIEGKCLDITHPDKVLWPALNLTKMDYLRYLTRMAPFVLPATSGRLSMFWCYPDGVNGKRYARKSRPSSAPEWLEGVPYNDSTRMVVDDVATLAWVAQTAALELHVEPDRVDCTGNPTYLAIDLDPSVEDRFHQVLEVALTVRSVLQSIQLDAIPKTSGATGLHLYVPIEPIYSFQETRRINRLVAEYVAAKLPHMVTLERVVNRRETKLYFDYLQLWRGKTMAAAYTPRATATATVSTPVTWTEIEHGFHPTDHTILTVPDRVACLGDLFLPISKPSLRYNLAPILRFLDKHKR